MNDKLFITNIGMSRSELALRFAMALAQVPAIAFSQKNLMETAYEHADAFIAEMNKQEGNSDLQNC